MRRIRLVVGVAIALAGCGAEQDFGVAPGAGAPGAPAPPVVGAGGDDAAAGDAGITGEAGAAPLTPCPTGRLCWADPLPTGDDYNSVLALADDDVWLGTATGTIVHWDGAKLTTTYQSQEEVGATRLWSDHGADLTAILTVVQDGVKQSRVMHWDGAAWKDAFTTCDITAIGTFVQAGTTRTVIGCSAGFVGIYTRLDQASATLPSLPGAAFAGLAAFASPSGDRVTVEAMRFDGTIAEAVLTMPETVAPVWRITSSPSTSTLGAASGGVALWAIAQNDIWAVHELCNDQEIDTVFRHFDGSAWTVTHTETTPAVQKSCGETLPGSRAWARSASDAYVAGLVSGALWHFDGAQWSRVTAGLDPNAITSARAFPVDAPYLAIGGTGTSTWAAGQFGQIHRLDASGQWTKLAGGDPRDEVVAISARVHDDVWALRRHDGATADDIRLDVLHYDGAAWKALPPLAPSDYPRFVSQDGPNLNARAKTSVLAFGPNDAWITSQIAASPADLAGNSLTTAMRLAHWDGATWTVHDLPNVHALWGSSSNDVWVSAGHDDTQPNANVRNILHWDGAAWTTIATDRSVVSISGSAPNDVWFASLGTETAPASLARWDGAALREVPLPAAVPVKVGVNGLLEDSRLFASGNGEAWLYGVEATQLFHYDGAAWTEVSNAAAYVMSMWGASPNDVWVVGFREDGASPTEGRSALLHWDGQVLARDVAPAVGPWLMTASGAGANDMWVGGAGGAILRTSLDARPLTH